MHLLRFFNTTGSPCRLKQHSSHDLVFKIWRNNKQLLDEVEHDSENYQGRGLCYLPKPKAEADNTNRGLDNSRYHAKTESNNCFIIQL